jgi:hypothetical protein
VRNWVTAYMFPVHRFLDSASYRCGPLPAGPCSSDTASDYSRSSSSEFGCSPLKMPSAADYSPLKG